MDPHSFVDCLGKDVGVSDIVNQSSTEGLRRLMLSDDRGIRWEVLSADLACWFESLNTLRLEVVATFIRQIVEGAVGVEFSEKCDLLRRVSANHRIVMAQRALVLVEHWTEALLRVPDFVELYEPVIEKQGFQIR